MDLEDLERLHREASSPSVIKMLETQITMKKVRLRSLGRALELAEK